MIKLLNHNEISFIQTSGNPHLIADLVNSTRIAAAAGKPKAKYWRGKKKSPQIHPPTQKEMQVFCHMLRDHAGKKAFVKTFRYKLPILWSFAVETRKFFWFDNFNMGWKKRWGRVNLNDHICISFSCEQNLQNPLTLLWFYITLTTGGSTR